MTYIGHLIFNISNYEISEKFYDILFSDLGIDYRIVHNSDDTKIKAYQIEGCPLYIRWSRDEQKEKFVRNVGLDHLCIGVDSKQQVDMLYKKLFEYGVVITRTPNDYPDYNDPYYAFYFRDPDGFPLEVVYMG